MNEELNKKMLKYAGFKRKKVTSELVEYWVKYVWHYPKPSDEFDIKPPNFTKSLDAIFKWLVPKLMDDGYGYILSDSCGKKPHVVTLYTGYAEGEERIVLGATAETPALALCLAIEKLIDKEKDESSQ